jgi:hypothetical protein
MLESKLGGGTQARKTEKDSRRAWGWSLPTKISKTTPCKERWDAGMDALIDPAKHFDTSGKISGTTGSSA